MSVRFEKTLACRKNPFKHSYTVECGNRLRVGVCAKNAVACRGLCVGPSRFDRTCPGSTAVDAL